MKITFKITPIRIIIIVLTCLLALIPLLLNFILRIPHIFNIVGDATDWLAFWGCYLGGILSAMVGFVTLYVSQKRQNLQIQIEYKQKSLQELRTLLSECVSLFDYSRIGTISLYLDRDAQKYDEVIYDLEQYINKIQAMYNTWGVIYADQMQEQVEEQTLKDKFQNTYKSCINVFKTNFSEMIKLLSNYKNCLDDYDMVCRNKQLRNEIQNLRNQENYIKENYLQPLFNAAQEWIRSEQKEIDDLKEKL